MSLTRLEYLYGVKEATWLDMNYVDAMKLKIELSDKVLTEIQATHYKDRDYHRKMAVIKAMSFNRKRINE